MAQPVIISCPTALTVACGVAFTINLTVRLFELTDLTVCAVLPAAACTFAGGSTSACQSHPGLPLGTHPISLTLTVTCPTGETYVVLMSVVASNAQGESHSKNVQLTINC